MRTSSLLSLVLAGLCSCSQLNLPADNQNANGNTNSNTNANANDNGDSDRFVLFEDPDSDFSTQDVHDVDGEIVRFDAARMELIWAADGSAFEGFDVNGNLLAGGFFSVRFGSEGGQQMAYFTETTPPTICDIQVQNGDLRISPTTVTVPQN